MELIEFPCRFPIKIMGLSESPLAECVKSCLAEHVSDAHAVEWRERLSRAGQYISITITLTATSQEQLDALYQALGKCAGVKMIL